jgi:hypothetical protein
VARIPANRHAGGVIGDFAGWENPIADHSRRPFASAGLLRRGAARRYARALVDRFDIRGGGVDTPARALSGVDEVVTTLLLNFIVLLFVSMMLDGPMKDPSALGWPQSVALRDDLQLDKLFPRTRAHTGLAYAAVLALLLAIVMRYTTLGFEARAGGANARAAAFVGVPVARTIAIVALIAVARRAAYPQALMKPWRKGER